MRKLHLAIPQYRSSHLSDPSSEINKIPVANWSVEQVCDWVTSKSFKAYRAVFRDGLVNGHMLLTITPEILETNGIHNMCVRHGCFWFRVTIDFNCLLCFGDLRDRWHRQAIMVAVQELKELLAKNASGVLVDQPHLERTCDVFIRYADAGDDVWRLHRSNLACSATGVLAAATSRSSSRCAFKKWASTCFWMWTTWAKASSTSSCGSASTRPRTWC